MPEIQFEDFMEALGQTIKRIRKEKGLTQGAIAERIGKPQSTVARFEGVGTHDCHVSLVFQICQALGEDLPDVMTQALRQLGASKKVRENDTDARWRVAFEKGTLLKGEKKRKAVALVEGIISLVE